MRGFVIAFAAFLVLVSNGLGPAQGLSPLLPEARTDLPFENRAIDYSGFLELAKKVQNVRASRRVPLEKFMKMAQDENTLILDTRSKWAHDAVHLAGAVHLNFSDFTEPKLAKVIPNKTTRILIYCNNNFLPPAHPDTFTFVKPDVTTNVLDAAGNLTGATEVNNTVISGTTNKSPRLALNIPTFVNLYGYGYKNVYELADQLSLDDARLQLEGRGLKKVVQSAAANSLSTEH